MEFTIQARRSSVDDRVSDAEVSRNWIDALRTTQG